MTPANSPQNVTNPSRARGMVVAKTLVPRVHAMPHHATVLITAPPAALLRGLRQRRPDLAVAPLDAGLPEAVPPGLTWCFVDWLLPDRSGLEMVRTLREARATRDSHITMVLEKNTLDYYLSTLYLIAGGTCGFIIIAILKESDRAAFVL